MKVISIPPDTPAQIVLNRMEAFAGGDFGRVWDAYHPDSNFRSAFPDRAAYVSHAEQNLSKTFRFVEWRVLLEEVGTVARVLLYNVLQLEGTTKAGIEGLELALTDEGWRILATARLEGENCPVAIETLSWSEFVRLTEGIFF